jgi:glycerol uptake operon antiterminator
VIDLDALLRDSRVIPALRDARDLDTAAAAPAQLVWVLTGEVHGIGELLARLAAADKTTCVNLDLVAGLASDAAAVRYLARCGARGVISTHTPALKAAQGEGLLAVQRTFLLDSQALATARRSIERFVPDAVEVLPAPVAPRAIAPLRAIAPTLPIIAGGLVASLAEVDQLVRAGIDAVSASEKMLWIV